MTPSIPRVSVGGAVRARASAALAILIIVFTALLAANGGDLQTISQPSTREPTSVDSSATVLEPGGAVEREVSRGQVHLYQLTLAAGELATVIVDQRGIHVAVQARRTDGSVIADFEHEIRRQGQEQVDLIADKAGAYELAVRAVPGVESGSYVIRWASRRPATDADRSLQEARNLRTAAARLEQAARFEEARPLFERALAISEPLVGPDALFVGMLVFDLAGNALESRDDPRAQSLYERSIAIFEKTWGPEHPYPAMARSRLALLLEHVGQGPKAEALLRPAIEVLEKTLGTEHPWFVTCLATQASIRTDAGDLAASEEINRRAMAILEKIDETHSARYAMLLNNLGEVYRQKQDLARAEDLFQRSLVVTQSLEGTESYHISIDYQNLGIIARERKDYPKAVDYDMRALSMRERILGPDHTDIAPLLNNLALVLHNTGDDAGALQTHFRALRIWEKSVGPYHRGTLTSVGNIARLYAATGDITKAIAFQRRADAIIETQLGLNLAVGSERQKLAFVNSVSERTDRTISLSLNEAQDNPDAGALAALVLLQRKGRVLDTMIDTYAAVRQRVADAADQALLDRLKTTTSKLARLALTMPDRLSPEDRQSPIKELEAQKERLEVELSERSAEFSAEQRPVTLEAVQAALPDDAALVEFSVFRPFDPKADRNAEAYSAPHYAAYVVRQHATPRGYDLGPVTGIDEAIDGLRQALRDPKRTDLKPRSHALDDRVMQPLRASLGGVTRLLVSPDGNLNLVPFEALVDERGRYLIERYAIGYLTSGRDLLRMQVARAPKSDAVIVADPFFGEPEVASASTPADTASRDPARATSERPVRTAVPDRAPRASATTGADLATMYFAPLGATAEEARAITGLFPEATLLTGRAASKSSLEHVQAPRILHIASHGFFLRDTTRATTQALPSPAGGGTRPDGTGASVDNPLLRSGLALAGANLTKMPHEDGILTALEAAGLNLWGTKLVTLSACDTGVGEVRNGEGVYGLRRAFVLAGTETLVMSLWPVSDYVTREMMTAYYIGLRGGLGRGDALRQAKLAMLKRSGRQHPFYWASFIQSGEWASLDGRRASSS